MEAHPDQPNHDALMAALAPNDAGLVAAVVVDADDGRVLMLGYMNREALVMTLRTEAVTFYSRSKSRLWMKGETSGHILRLVDLRIDCDGDALLVRARPLGPTCHTGEDSCFFRRYEPGEQPEGGALIAGAVAPTPIATPLHRLEQVLVSRRDAPPGQPGDKPSYVRGLLDGGVEKFGAKIVEEAQELVDAMQRESDERVLSEAADLVFHAMVGLTARGLTIAQVANVLGQRHGIGGLRERAERSAGPRTD